MWLPMGMSKETPFNIVLGGGDGNNDGGCDCVCDGEDCSVVVAAVAAADVADDDDKYDGYEKCTLSNRMWPPSRHCSSGVSDLSMIRGATLRSLNKATKWCGWVR